ncbi:MAG: hypothetical protein CL868_06295 [Cytophagaceae bacterium]|nr:hypothetical protein [Cytophagaceae bacterium]
MADKSIKKTKKVFTADKYVCKYISEEWLSSQDISSRKYGKKYGVNYHIIEKIQQEDGYNLPLSTLSTLCFNHGIKLSDFFKNVEKRYSDFLTDDYFIKK